MPVTRSNVVLFSTGLAVGAVACATFPRWKGKVTPLVNAAMAGAGAAFADASAHFADAGQGGAEGTSAADPHSGSSMRNGTPRGEPSSA